jgi:hypothetical protein
MDRRNKYDTKDSLKLGDVAEQLFKNIDIKKGWSINQATQQQNIDEHWDFLIWRESEKYKVDVKAMKRMSRYDPSVQDKWFWVEFHGVRPDDRGWLYDGKSDLIAIERTTSFLIVKRQDLIQLAEKLVDKTRRVFTAREAKYKLYQRTGRPDLISMVEIEKLKAIQWDVWQKI